MRLRKEPRGPGPASLKHAPLEIVWSPLALARLQEVRAYVALDKPQAAERLAIRMVTLVETLRTNPYLGRTGAEPGIRELVVGGTPYLILYRVHRRHITINTVWHASQDK